MAFGSVLSVGEDNAAARKMRGAFFTPCELARFMGSWAIRSGGDQVLEPSCGEGQFVDAAVKRFAELGGEASAAAHIVGFEIHGRSAAVARARCAASAAGVQIVQGSFLDAEVPPSFDAVVGNPPYVRFQAVSDAQREAMRRISQKSGVALSALSSLWAPFVVQSALALKAGGRLALVLPAELLTVNYAAPIRTFLLESFASIQLITFDQAVFPEVQEEVVVLLADGYKEGSSEVIAWRSCDSLRDLDSARLVDYAPPSRRGRWSGLFAAGSSLDALRELMSERKFQPLGSWGRIALGAVTGNNGYFTLSAAEVEEYGLGASDVVDLCPPGSRHVRRLALTDRDFADLRADDLKTFLFFPHGGEASSAARAYIERGHRQGVDRAYKCRTRSPWWHVPLGAAPDAFVTYMNAFGPNICANDAQVPCLNSCHGLFFRDETRDLGRSLLPLASLNSATLFGAEIVGRAYGGGMLKLEPREAADLPVPSPEFIRACEPELTAIIPYVARALKRREMDAAVKLVDAVLSAALPSDRAVDFSQMASSGTMMRLRRKKRSKRARG